MRSSPVRVGPKFSEGPCKRHREGAASVQSLQCDVSMHQGFEEQLPPAALGRGLEQTLP